MVPAGQHRVVQRFEFAALQRLERQRAKELLGERADLSGFGVGESRLQEGGQLSDDLLLLLYPWIDHVRLAVMPVRGVRGCRP
ncbi:hypothetical protein D3C81_2143580 [compost metagenome]